jgi:hypothetical protein
MENFGLLKSKIEQKLLESYKNNTFKSEMVNFKKYVLENKNISKLYYLYDELSSKKGLSKDVVGDYINESINVFENTISKIKTQDLVNVKKWVSNVKTNNIYESVDNVLSLDVLNIEKRVLSKKQLSESLTQKKVENTSKTNLPLSTMVNIANKTITNYIDGLNESEKKELSSLLSADDKVLNEEFNNMQTKVVEKLSGLKESESDNVVKVKLQETIDKVSNETYNKIGYYKLKNLFENI